MKKVNVRRRQFLHGAGGFALGLPFLPSLVPMRAWGVEFSFEVPRCFAAMTTVHGAVRPENMYPAASTLTDSTSVYTGYTVKHGKLVSSPAGGGHRLSPVLTSSSLTPALVAKMNVLRGFDLPYYIGHHSGGHLGNYVRSDQGPKNMAAFATIDQVMAWSKAFYGDAQGVTLRSMVTGRGGFGGAPSFAYSNPQAGTGSVNNLSPESNPSAIFSRVFPGGGAMPKPDAAPAGPPIVSRILANYKSLRESNRRLSTEDRQRLDDHVAQLSELERRVKTSTAMMASCGGVKAPAGGGYEGMNDVIAFAFACGASRVATISLPNGQFTNYGGNWHQDVAHNAGSNQPRLTAANQLSFHSVFVDLIKKLDAIALAPGVTALDASLVQWTQESGWNTHDAQDMPIVMAGAAGGFFKTGMFVDYRSGKRMRMFGGLQQQELGIPHRRWLATALLAMGLPASEWEKNGAPGYGDPLSSNDYKTAAIPQVWADSSKPVPVISNG